jgi:hypothetical protein
MLTVTIFQLSRYCIFFEKHSTIVDARRQVPRPVPTVAGSISRALDSLLFARAIGVDTTRSSDG